MQLLYPGTDLDVVGRFSFTTIAIVLLILSHKRVNVKLVMMTLHTLIFSRSI